MIKNAPVLIVGAGPTGMFLALSLTRLGVRVRIVDQSVGPGTTSRALLVQARTLEFYRQLDLAEEVVSRGLPLGAANLWRAGDRAARVELGAIGEGLTPYPFGVIYPQDEHERMLEARLAALGVEVERGTKLVGAREAADAVHVSLEGPDGPSACETSFVAGCDGARSTVRRIVEAEFPGGTYDHTFYVADVEGRGARFDGELHIALDEEGFFALFPLAGGRGRLIGTVLDAAASRGRDLRFEDVDRRPLDAMGLAVERVNWFSTYRVHHRVADQFRRGRLFLLGDAAHIHSPVGGQGMNTGLGDAMNLAWKLAAVLDRRAKPALLDTYEEERIGFARQLVATTDRLFRAASSDSAIAELVRTGVVPRLAPRVLGSGLGRRTAFRLISQTGIAYRDSALSGETHGDVHAGDRLPWVASADNFAPLRTLDWQGHVYGTPREDVRAACEERGLALVTFGRGGDAEAAGLREGATYVVRPDGHVGAVCEDARGVAAYLDAHGIVPRGV